ncbi:MULTISPECIES: glutamine synthetase family protein [Rhodobacterales]|jgi:glutamine synthetase|uniref:Glutamine synthetase n=1 Tax=Phaeobacter gallaeciensis TaxID=60890 RepID=A0A1B0ZN33_9RHOB|nr:MULTISPECIES: glutamine synthetase family protein [Phaeobacter]MDF1771054.1 glutamine synthetase family protein [Pseudophaeobacter sp. bin_em_oilr2.035]ANP35592.1 glutamine synthetase [Phaeobacter gallaeciensis]MDE4061297.1 glutamine synthetase family protein [Phaeobacter gallaeciensis]MDE4098689.1 glutamine synthetase family protein [Phaeobacter gallaeciensis]MDE4107554.1 glutamine synthetase family protein [Phaeobacter gallaeciensis]
MSAWLDTLPDAAKSYLEGRRLDEVECVISDLPGIARGKAVPATKFAKQEYFHLPDSIFYQTITGDWGEAADEDGFIEKDMTLYPDMTTATAAPWTGDWTLQVIHDAFDRDGNPIACSPRNVLKRVVQLYHDKGWEPVVAPEMEFFLVARNVDPAHEIKPMMGRSGRPAAARQAYSMTAVDEFGPVIDDIYDFAEAQGFEIDGITQEGGAGQLEINLRHGDPVKLADEVFYFKRLIREAALRHDCFATFMAKPIENEPGSAMHIHHSIIDKATGENIFSGPQGGETDAFYHFIAGLQNHLPAGIAVMAPYVNSYRRYVKDHAAPINLEWGRDNRTTGIRVPLSSPSARRVENRLAGMDCNPYLGIAVSLACGYLGLIQEERPRRQFKGDAYEGEGDIPQVMGQALDLFDTATELHEILGPEFARVYGIVKRSEYEEFLQVISPWEREHLLLNV